MVDHVAMLDIEHLEVGLLCKPFSAAVQLGGKQGSHMDVMNRRLLVAAALEHLVLRGEHFAQVAPHENHAIWVVVRQIIQQAIDHLDRLAHRLLQPGRILLHLLDPLEFIVSLRVVFVGPAHVINQRFDAAGTEHVHHHRGSRAGEAGYNGDVISCCLPCGHLVLPIVSVSKHPI